LSAVSLLSSLLPSGRSSWISFRNLRALLSRQKPSGFDRERFADVKPPSGLSMKSTKASPQLRSMAG